MKTTKLMIVAASMGLIGFAQAEEAKKERPERKLPPEVIEKFDKDGDGKLNEEEREAARAEHKARMEERRKKALEKYDTNKDGELSEEERKVRREDMMKRFDKDGDGELSEEERKEMRKVMGRHHGHHGKRKERREEAQ